MLTLERMGELLGPENTPEDIDDQKCLLGFASEEVGNRGEDWLRENAHLFVTSMRHVGVIS